MPAEKTKNTKMIIDTTGNWRVEVDGKVVGEGTLTLDPASSPKKIDYTFKKGEHQVFSAIYELKGDSFKHCGTVKGRRPERFETRIRANTDALSACKERG